MKIKYFISLAMAVALMTACSNEEDPGAHITNGMLQATVEGNASSARAGFDKDGAFYWSTGDRIGVTTSMSATSFSVLTLSDGAGQASGSFNGGVTGSIEGYAVYPFNEEHKMQGTELTYGFPASYTYTTVDTDYFSPAQGEGNSFNPAMWGKITNGSVGLKHLGGVFCIKVEKLLVGTNLKLTLTTDKKISGTFKVDLSTTTPKLDAQSAANAEEKAVSITFTNNAENTSGVFYIPVPTGTYENVRVKILDGSTEKANVACGNYTIERRDLKQLLISNGTITGGEEKTVASVSEVASALATNSNAVSVTNQVSGTSNTISLPAQTTAAPVSVAFQNIASDTKISFTDGASAQATPVKELTIAIPAGVAPSIDCTMEKSTVTLSSNAGTATYNEVIAATAENTLILDKGVTVNTLKVKKGNVRVKKGAKITAIERTSGNQSVVKIYKEEGAEIPQGLDENTFTVLSAEIADMEAIAKDGGNYTLTSDIVLSSPLVVEGTMTLSLNGHSIKPKAEGLDKVLNTQDALILVRRGGDLTIDDNGGGSIDCNNMASVYAAVKLTDSNDENGENQAAVAKLTVKGGTLKGYSWGICGNGLRHGTETVISGGIITAVAEDEPAIYHPQEGTLKVSGGEIIGGSGIEIRSGALTVTGGKISSRAQSFTKKANGNGATMIGVAVAVSQHTTNKDLSVTISDGSLTGPYALYEEDLQGEPNNISLSVTGGTFAGKVFSKDCSAFIEGGTFSDPGALSYLKANANVKVKLQKDYEGPGLGIYANGNGAKAKVDVDLNNHTWILTDAPLHGSTGTVSQYFHLEKEATVILKNGTLKPKEAATGKMFIQNYCNLTLENLIVQGDNNCEYVISNNNGTCTMTDCTITASEGKCAFDVYSYSRYPNGVTVTVQNSTINGKVEFGGDSNKKNGKLIVEGNTTLNGDLVVTEAYYDKETPNIIIGSSVSYSNHTEWADYVAAN